MSDTETAAIRVFKVGSFYPYHIVAAYSENEAIEVVEAAIRNDDGGRWSMLRGEGTGESRHGDPEWVVVELDISKPGIIDTNMG